MPVALLKWVGVICMEQLQIVVGYLLKFPHQESLTIVLLMIQAQSRYYHDANIEWTPNLIFFFKTLVHLIMHSPS